MARVIHVPMKPVPSGATDADRRRMFEEWLAEHNRMNTHLTGGFGYWLLRTLGLGWKP